MFSSSAYNSKKLCLCCFKILKGAKYKRGLRLPHNEIYEYTPHLSDTLGPNRDGGGPLSPYVQPQPHDILAITPNQKPSLHCSPQAGKSDYISSLYLNLNIESRVLYRGYIKLPLCGFFHRSHPNYRVQPMSSAEENGARGLLREGIDLDRGVGRS